MPNLYVTEPGALLEKEAGQLLITREGEIRLAVPATRVDQVVLVGPVGVTTPALHFLLDRGIDLVLLTSGGAFRGRLAADLSKHVALRHRQHQRQDDPLFCLALARVIVAGKLRNYRALCLRWDESNADPLAHSVAADLLRLIAATSTALDRAALMGIEGQGTARYFAMFRQTLLPPWTFPRRARRPPPDPVNALISLLSTLLHESCRAALEAAGLDPACGFLHTPHYGRASLALDLMEEFRPLLADSVALLLLNKRLLTPDDFIPMPDGGVRLSDHGWRCLADQYGRRLKTLVTPPGLDRRLSYQKVLEVQARQIRRLILGETETYEPFRVR